MAEIVEAREIVIGKGSVFLLYAHDFYTWARRGGQAILASGNKKPAYTVLVAVTMDGRKVWRHSC